MKENQFKEITSWQKETFGEATALSKIAHLREEIEELAIDIDSNGIDKRLEFADCFFLLFGAASADGMTYEDICNAIQEKFEINKVRKWGKPDTNGVVNHIKQCMMCGDTEEIADHQELCYTCWKENSPEANSDGDVIEFTND